METPLHDLYFVGSDASGLILTGLVALPLVIGMFGASLADTIYIERSRRRRAEQRSIERIARLEAEFAALGAELQRARRDDALANRLEEDLGTAYRLPRSVARDLDELPPQ